MGSIELGSIVSSSVPLLERALYDEEEKRISPELQLRGTVCAVATGALQQFVRGRHGIELERRMAVLDKAPRGLNSRLLRHVGLFDGDTMIDPTYSQFFSYVGVDRFTASADPQLAALFPDTKIAVIPAEDSDAFADSFARQAQDMEEAMAEMDDLVPQTTYAPLHALTGKSLDEKREVYRHIWRPSNYEVTYPIIGGEQSPSLTRRIARIADRMIELEHASTDRIDT